MKKYITIIFVALFLFLSACTNESFLSDPIPNNEENFSIIPNVHDVERMYCDNGFCDFPDRFESSLYSTFYFSEFIHNVTGEYPSSATNIKSFTSLRSMEISDLWYFSNVYRDQVSSMKSFNSDISKIITDALSSDFSASDLYMAQEISVIWYGKPWFNAKALENQFLMLPTEDPIQVLINYYYLTKAYELYPVTNSNNLVYPDFLQCEESIKMLINTDKLPITLLYEYLSVCDTLNINGCLNDNDIFAYVSRLETPNGAYGLFPGMGANAMPIYYASEIINLRKLDVDLLPLVNQVSKLKRLDNTYIDYIEPSPDPRSTFYALSILKLNDTDISSCANNYLKECTDNGIYPVLIAKISDIPINEAMISNGIHYLLSIPSDIMENINVQNQWLFLACELSDVIKNNNAAFHSYRDLLISKSKDIDTSIPENKYLLSLLYEKLDFKPDTPLDLPPDMISDSFILVYLQKNASFSDFKFPDSIQTSYYQIDNFSMENLFHYEYISKFGKESK